MRLFAKFFLCTTIIICIALLLSGYLLITSAHESALQREMNRAVMQYQFDKFTVQANLIAHEEVLRYGISEGFLNRLASDLNGLTAFFADDTTILLSELPDHTDFSILGNVTEHTHAHMFQTINEASYILVAGMIAQESLTIYLLTAMDISNVVAQREQMMQSFFNIYIITLALSIFVIVIFASLMTKPINRINKAAAEIAKGRYNDRLPESGGDEIGDLSKSFNLMADAVEDKIFELSENARQKEDFVASFAHELKTPLTSVIGYADMMYQKNLSAEQVKDAAWYILNEGLRLEALSLKLMDLIVMGRHEFTMEEMNSEEIIQNITGSIQPILDEKNVPLKLDIQSAYIIVEYDLFKTLLLNLIDNAIKAGSNTIKIGGTIDNDRYLISITDNGRGIPERDLAQITEAFYVVDKSRSRRQHGVGLGLALSAKIAEIHGSTLEISSVEGVGTTVEITLMQRFRK